jgi:hypothetical protein
MNNRTMLKRILRQKEKRISKQKILEITEIPLQTCCICYDEKDLTVGGFKCNTCVSGFVCWDCNRKFVKNDFTAWDYNPTHGYYRRDANVSSYWVRVKSTKAYSSCSYYLWVRSTAYKPDPNFRWAKYVDNDMAQIACPCCREPNWETWEYKWQTMMYKFYDKTNVNWDVISNAKNEHLFEYVIQLPFKQGLKGSKRYDLISELWESV